MKSVIRTQHEQQLKRLLGADEETNVCTFASNFGLF